MRSPASFASATWAALIVLDFIDMEIAPRPAAGLFAHERRPAT